MAWVRSQVPKARYFLSVSTEEPNQWTQPVYWSSAVVSLLCQNAHIVLPCCHLLQIKTLLQCTPAGHQSGGSKPLLGPCRGIQHSFYENNFKLQTPELKYEPFRRAHPHRWPEQVQGNLCWQQSCFRVFHHLMSLAASRSISDRFLKSLWGEALPAAHTYLYELQNSKAFWSAPVKTTVLLCDRSGNPSEAEEKSILNNLSWTPATCTGKQA